MRTHSVLMVAAAVLATASVVASAQSTITFDATGQSPTGRQNAVGGTTFDIGVTDGQVRGGNLYHQFGQFSVGLNDVAAFQTNPSTTNVIGLVNGGAPSLLQGRVEVGAIPGQSVNFFLLNPAGISVEQTATFQVPGRLTLAATDRLDFDDGGFVSATNAAGSSLSFANPADFGFLGTDGALVLTDATITDNAALGRGQVEAVTLAGGDVRLVGDSALTFTDPLRAFDPATQPTVRVAAGRDATLSGNTLVRVDNLTDAPQQTEALSIHIDAGRSLALADEVIVISQPLFTGTDRGGDIKLSAPDITLNSNPTTTTGAPPFILISTKTFSDADAGNIIFEASDTMTVLGHANIWTEVADRDDVIAQRGLTDTPQDLAELQSNAGDIVIRAGSLLVDPADSLPIVGAPRTYPEGGGLRLTTTTEGDGDAGDVRISVTGDARLLGRTRIITEVKDEQQVGELDGSANDVLGNAGDILVTGQNIVIDGDVALRADGCCSGDAATIRLTATDTLTATNTVDVDADGNALRNLSPQFLSRTFGSADATEGNVVFDARVIEIGDGTLLRVRSRGDGQGGGVMLTASDRVTVGAGAEILAETFTTGDAGNIEITANVVTIAGTITAQSRATAGSIANAAPNGAANTANTGPGDAGTILITGNSVELQPGAVLVTSTRDADGGLVRITINDGDLILRNGSAIRTGVNGSQNQAIAGNVTVDARYVVLLDGSVITTNNQGRGTAGNISLARTTFLAEGAVLDAGSAFGTPGSVLLQDGGELVTDFGTVAPSLADPRSLTEDPCRAVAEGRSGIEILRGGSARVSAVDLPAFFLGSVPFPDSTDTQQSAAGDVDLALASTPCGG